MSSSNRATQLPSRATAQWQICYANPPLAYTRSRRVYIVPPSLGAGHDAWLCSVLRALRPPAYPVPSFVAGGAFLRRVGERFGSDSALSLFALLWCFSCRLSWQYICLSRGWSWMASCDERGTKRVCAKLKSRGYCMRSSSEPWDDARILCNEPWDTRNVDVVNEHDVAAVLREYARDVEIDALLAEVFYRRCGLGRTEASNWIVERIATW